MASAIEQASKRSLKSGKDARAVTWLAALADRLHVQEAYLPLLEIADRGVLGGFKGRLEPDMENIVLYALSGLQKRNTLWERWLRAWGMKTPEHWPVITTGIRMCDPRKAPTILPSAVSRSTTDPKFSLGEVLWSYCTDPKIKSIAPFLDEVSLGRCQEALRSVGATEEEITSWLQK